MSPTPERIRKACLLYFGDQTFFGSIGVDPGRSCSGRWRCCTRPRPRPPRPLCLRSLTLIKGLVYPPKVRAYLDYYEAKGDVPLYDVMAL